MAKNNKKSTSSKSKLQPESKLKTKSIVPKSHFEIHDEMILKKSPDILSRSNADGSIAMIRVDSDKNFYALDGIAANVWKLLNGKTSLAKLKLKLSQEHKIDLKLISKDTNHLVKKLFVHKLILIQKA